MAKKRMVNIANRQNARRLIGVLKKRMKKGVVVLNDFDRKDGSIHTWESYLRSRLRLSKNHEECIRWSETSSQTKYGLAQDPGRFIDGIERKSSAIPAHRLIWSIINQIDLDDLDDRFVIRHLCHNRDCVQPHHLQLGTYYENSRDTRLHKEGYCLIPHKG